MTVLYGICECCLNCAFRGAHINSKILCDVTHILVAERMKCNVYKRTTNKHILSAEANLIPKQPKTKDLIDWCRANNLLSN